MLTVDLTARTDHTFQDLLDISGALPHLLHFQSKNPEQQGSPADVEDGVFVGPVVEGIGSRAVEHAVDDKSLLGCLKWGGSQDGSCVCEREVGQQPERAACQGRSLNALQCAEVVQPEDVLGDAQDPEEVQQEHGHSHDAESDCH